jgi:MurNAc alpha-1-phosphate uridylyltransferase
MVISNQRFPAMVMAAGLGRRMRGYRSDIPKPLVEVAGRPLISYSLQLLWNARLTDIIYNTHYLAPQVEAYMQKRRDFFSLQSYEPTLLETGGGIRKAMPHLQESFFTLNSDVICCDSEIPVLTQMQQRWDATIMDGLLLLIPREKAVGYDGPGDFSMDAQGRLIPPQADLPRYVFTGVQHLHQRIFTDAPEGKFSLSILYRKALAEGSPRFYGMVHQAAWYHVGDPEARLQAEERLQEELVCG